MIIAAADGSSLSNPGPAGWAWYIDDERWAAGGWPRGTNNMGELMAVLNLLEQTADTGEELTIVCDSQYVINALTKWMPGWKRKGWRKADGKPVLNVELLKDLDKALAKRIVHFEWVKGHSGHLLNEAADARARAAATAYQQGTPVDRGPGFRPGPAQPPSTHYEPTSAEPPSLLDEPDPTEHPAWIAQQSLVMGQVRVPEQRDAVLHPKFVAVDDRGRIQGRGRTLATPMSTSFPSIELELLGVEELAPWVVLLRWRERTAETATVRSAVWIKRGDDWRLRYDQRTPVL